VATGKDYKEQFRLEAESFYNPNLCIVNCLIPWGGTEKDFPVPVPHKETFGKSKFLIPLVPSYLNGGSETFRSPSDLKSLNPLWWCSDCFMNELFKYIDDVIFIIIKNVVSLLHFHTWCRLLQERKREEDECILMNDEDQRCVIIESNVRQNLVINLENDNMSKEESLQCYIDRFWGIDTYKHQLQVESDLLRQLYVERVKKVNNVVAESRQLSFSKNSFLTGKEIKKILLSHEIIVTEKQMIEQKNILRKNILESQVLKML